MNEEDVEQTLPEADCTRDMTPRAEITALHIYHHPENDRDVNGFTFVVRMGGHEFTVGAREGVSGNGVEPIAAVPYDTGGQEYESLVSGRHELFEAAELTVVEAAPRILALFADLKG